MLLLILAMLVVAGAQATSGLLLTQESRLERLSWLLGSQRLLPELLKLGGHPLSPLEQQLSAKEERSAMLKNLATYSALYVMLR